jgi:hypothetical protein
MLDIQKSISGHTIWECDRNVGSQDLLGLLSQSWHCNKKIPHEFQHIQKIKKHCWQSLFHGNGALILRLWIKWILLLSPYLGIYDEQLCCIGKVALPFGFNILIYKNREWRQEDLLFFSSTVELWCFPPVQTQSTMAWVVLVGVNMRSRRSLASIHSMCSLAVTGFLHNSTSNLETEPTDGVCLLVGTWAYSLHRHSFSS